MRRISPRRVAAGWAGAVVLAGLAVQSVIAADDPKTALSKKPEVLKVEETIGDLAKIPPMADLRVEGVGLVVGLDNTGSDAQPGVYRNKLLDKMRKERVTNPAQILADPSTSLVLIRGKIPAGITTEDVFDVELELPPGSTTTSLAGGQLLLSELFQVGFNDKGDPLDGQMKAKVYGSVMVGTTALPDDPKVGRVLGGAKVKRDEPYYLILTSKRKSVRNAALLQALINNRFNRLRGIEQEGMATAKTDEGLELKVPRNYHHNQYRYFQVVENLQVVNHLPEVNAARMDKWGKELLDPSTAGAAAIHLEGVGRNAIASLKTGLSSPHPQVRYFAAEALAYLGDDSGVNVLADAAANRPEFRAYSFAALAAMDQPASSMRLQELMAHPDTQVRYGAFNSLRITDRTHPALGRVRVREDEPEPEAEEDGSMEIRIASPRKKPRRPDPFDLYVVDCEGPPLVHVAESRRCEIVVFGRDQKLQPPAVLGAGPFLINATDGDSNFQVSRIGSEALDGPDQKVPTRGLYLAEVIRVAANLGATYPEILSLLEAADRQQNLSGALVVDAVPTAAGLYEEAQLAGRDVTSKTDPDVSKAGADGEKAPRKGLIQRFFRRPNK